MRAHVMVLVASASLGCTRATVPPPNPTPAVSCCRQLTTVYEASILKIDVMRVAVAVDEATAAAVASLVRSAPRSDSLEEQVARRYRRAGVAAVDVEFLMAMSGDAFLRRTAGSLRGLAQDGVVLAEDAERLAAEARERFGFLTTSGIQVRDRIRYQVTGDTVTTAYLRGDQVLMRDRQVGALHREALLGSYFAPSSDFRRGLLAAVISK